MACAEGGSTLTHRQMRVLAQEIRLGFGLGFVHLLASQQQLTYLEGKRGIKQLLQRNISSLALHLLPLQILCLNNRQCGHSFPLTHWQFFIHLWFAALEVFLAGVRSAQPALLFSLSLSLSIFSNTSASFITSQSPSMQWKSAS